MIASLMRSFMLCHILSHQPHNSEQQQHGDCLMPDTFSSIAAYTSAALELQLMKCNEQASTKYQQCERGLRVSVIVLRAELFSESEAETFEDDVHRLVLACVQQMVPLMGYQCLRKQLQNSGYESKASSCGSIEV